MICEICGEGETKEVVSIYDNLLYTVCDTCKCEFATPDQIDRNLKRNTKRLIISLDYDYTYTEDPILWNTFLSVAKDRGHQVYVVTMRYPEEPIDDEVARFVDGVIYTSRKAKKAYVALKDIHIDIWIDDNPLWLFTDATARDSSR